MKMKKASKLFIIASLLITGITIGCKKYDEGPGFSLRGKKARLVNEWKLDNMLSDGKKVSSLPTITWDIQRDGTIISNEGSSSYKGTWLFSSSKENFTTTFGSGGGSNTYEILKLKNNELWVKRNNNEYHFEKK